MRTEQQSSGSVAGGRSGPRFEATWYHTVTLAAAIALAACGSPRVPAGNDPGSTELDPCGGPGHPCALAEAAPEAVARTDELVQQVFQRLTERDDANLSETAAWLETQAGVVSVARGDGAIRFRVRNGVGHWIFLRTFPTVATLGGSAAPALRADAFATPQALLMTPPAAFETAAPPQAESADDRQRKKALLLSPFRWEWEILGVKDGIDDVARVLRARDYRPEDVTVVTTRLDPENPACQSADRWGKCEVIRDVQPRHFMSWTNYNYIHLLTHGNAVRIGDHTLTAVMTPWTVPAVDAATPSSLEQLVSSRARAVAALIERIGTEEGSIFITVPKSHIPTVGPGLTFSEGVPTASLAQPIGLNPELTDIERGGCQTALRRRSDIDRRMAGDPLARTASDKPCMIYPLRLMIGKFVLLTSAFFQATYPKGIDDAVVLISACSSAVARDLLGVLKGRNTVVLGWNKTVAVSTAAAAGTLIAKSMVEVDEPFKSDSGLTAEQAIDRIKALLRDAQDNKPSRTDCLDPPSEAIKARCLLAGGTHTLTVLNDAPADAATGATLVMVGDGDVRAREVAYLVGPGNQELADGGSLAVLGAAGDGENDDVALKIRVDGLAREDDPQAVRLAVAIDDRRIAVSEPLAKDIGAGVWELDYRLPLGRDHSVEDVVDVEVIADLPGGKESRWLYEDIRLTSCYWRGEMTGPIARTIGGYSVLLGRMTLPGRAVGDDASVVSSIGLGQAPGDTAPADGLSLIIDGEMGPGDFPFQSGFGSRNGGWISIPEVPMGTRTRGRLRIALHDPGRMVVGGFAVAYAGPALPDFEDVEIELRGEFVWTPACPTVADSLRDLGRRTSEFIRERGGR